ncbi:aldo/keto reductase [Aureimonas jatrophae]|uniref:D-threo-aldose 1-dehydrogenase n=1 Tax=Aureimonas jatrophae TaxID=1166073 RepID=A0A1H0KLL3_9HYPH|nr:aldo/keto reductase [Aureimonas jatrophae]MBB3948774.1 D-threo-aldose 1-dehydrogenase [Aureimonas jatrophae]SDO56884.1 D-threo-aldose 1-dehydrogenase [Aureimonas jatrophae]
MNKRRIGRTALEITEISLGGAALGNLYRAVPREDAMAVMDGAWEAGIRYFDTAPFYGFGLSERRMGDFLQEKPRDAFVLSTKVGRRLRPAPGEDLPGLGYVDPLPFAVEYDYSYDAIMRSVESSYARLGLNRIDILFVHDIGVYTHGPELTRTHLGQLFGSGLKALEELKSSGVIGAYGLGVNEVDVCLTVLREAPLDCILLAGRYTLLDRAAERELLPLCRQHGTSIVVGGVFNSGILATGAREGANFDYGPANEEVLAAVRGLEEVAEREGIPLSRAALQFPLNEPAVASILLGTGRPESLQRNLAGFAPAIEPARFAAFEPHTINR